MTSQMSIEELLAVLTALVSCLCVLKLPGIIRAWRQKDLEVARARERVELVKAIADIAQSKAAKTKQGPRNPATRRNEW